MTRHETMHEVYPILFAEDAAFKDTYGGMSGMVFLESHRIVPRDVDSDTVVVFMHPTGGGAFLPFVQALARAGLHVIYCNSRYRGNDSALIMEKVVVDLGQAIADARRRFGYERVVLAGWSGGGSLSLYYQQQARHATVTATPAGDPPNLTEAELVPADAMLLVAAHPSRHRVLVDSLDPSITDEARPDARDEQLDLYAPRGPKPPYDPAFVEDFRAAQRERNRRITAAVKQRLAELRAAGRPDDERGFVVRGTMADPRWLDPTIDPNERRPGMSYLGDPRVVNDGPVGLARFCTLRSWLSQWSIDDARGDGIAAAADVGVPTLVVCNGADEVCTPGYAQELFDGVGHPDKTFLRIDGANHYYLGREQIPRLAEAVTQCMTWLAERGLAPVAVA
jgi:alpha-beta hydrolase superfamily lysophospholipase